MGKNFRNALKPLLAGAVVALLTAGGAGVAHADASAPTGITVKAAPGDTVPAPNWPGGECVLSDPHLVFDDEMTNTKASMTWNASTATPVDPSNSNFHLRSINVGITNLSAHTYYDTTYFISWFYLARGGTNQYNYAPWDPAATLFDTQVPPTYPWASGWDPRDPGTPGAQTTLGSGVVGGNPLAPVIVLPGDLGKDASWIGSTRPGYELPDIAPGASQSFGKTLRIERPTNNGAYAYSLFRVVSVTTCLPVPTITQPTVADSELTGTGTTVGDVITVRDQDGN